MLPTIIHIYEFAISDPDFDSPTPYMVMDYIEGKTLKDYIESTSRIRKYPSASDVVQLFASISLAIDYAHQHKVIHRDIKPANILLDSHNISRNPMGEPILGDFGLFKMLSTATGTFTSVLTGTPYYLSPEQAVGHTWLAAVKKDAITLLNDQQLNQANTLSTFNDLANNAEFAYSGQVDPISLQVQHSGVVQIYNEIQRLATLQLNKAG